MTKKLKVNGTIILNDFKWIYDRFGMDSTSPRDIVDELPEDGEDVLITINSGGGYVTAGNEIYTELMSYEGNVTVDIIFAGSAASVIAMAGKTVRMSPIGRIMVHNASTSASGDYHEMDKTSDQLQSANSSLANSYVKKSKQPKETILELMDKETWLTADEAIELGFADETMFEEKEENPVELIASVANVIPPKVIDKMQSELKEPMVTGESMFDTDELVDEIARKVIKNISNGETNQTDTSSPSLDNKEKNESKENNFLNNFTKAFSQKKENM